MTVSPVSDAPDATSRGWKEPNRLRRLRGIAVGREDGARGAGYRAVYQQENKDCSVRASTFQAGEIKAQETRWRLQELAARGKRRTALLGGSR